MGPNKTKYNSKWLDKVDNNGDPVNLYIRPVSEDNHRVRCTWCTSDFDIGSRGFLSIKTHSEQKKHVNTANIRQGRNNRQGVLAVVVAGHDNNNEVAAQADQQDVEQRPREGGEGGGDVGNQRVFPVFARGGFTGVTGREARPKTLLNQVTLARSRYLLSAAENQLSFASCERQLKVLPKLDPNSEILKQMPIGRKLASVICSEAIGPFYLEAMLKKARQAPVFTLGLDSATNKRGGLDQHLDLKIRFFDSDLNRVTDNYLDSLSVWKEPAERQFKETMEALSKHNMDVGSMCSISRDNPNVNKALVKMFEEHMKDKGYPPLVDIGPCTLHPVHTSYHKALSELDVDVFDFAVELHGYFKYSTPRREDLLEVGQIFDEETDLFCQRPCGTRWLSALPVLTRIRDKWNTLTTYFCEFVVKSTHQNDKRARETDRFKKIYNLLKPSQNAITEASISWGIHLATKTSTFLKMFQKEGPMVQKLWIQSVLLLDNVMQMVSTDVPDGALHLQGHDLSDSTNWKDLKHVDVGRNVKQILADETFDPDKKRSLLRQFRNSGLEMAKYLQSHLPILNENLQLCHYVSPLRREEALRRESVKRKLKNSILQLGENFHRFSQADLQLLDSQIGVYLSLPEVPEYDDRNDRVEDWWLDVFKLFVQRSGDRDDYPHVLERIIMSVLSLSHGQAFVERGFSSSKWILAGNRESLSMESFKAQKTMKETCEKYEGADKVPISANLLEEVKLANSKHTARLAKEKRDKAAEENRLEAEAQLAAKRKEREEVQASWDGKMKKLQTEVKEKEKLLRMKQASAMQHMDDATKLKSPLVIQFHLGAAKLDQEAANTLTSDILKLKNEVAKLSGKKPRTKE